MNSRLSEVKNKDKRINELTAENMELKQSQETLNNNYKLQIKSLNDSCKQLIAQNNALKEAQTAQPDAIEKQKYDKLQTEYEEKVEENKALQAEIDESMERMSQKGAEYEEMKSKLTECEKE